MRDNISRINKIVKEGVDTIDEIVSATNNGIKMLENQFGTIDDEEFHYYLNIFKYDKTNFCNNFYTIQRQFNTAVFQIVTNCNIVIPFCTLYNYTKIAIYNKRWLKSINCPILSDFTTSTEKYTDIVKPVLETVDDSQICPTAETIIKIITEDCLMKCDFGKHLELLLDSSISTSVMVEKICEEFMRIE